MKKDSNLISKIKKHEKTISELEELISDEKKLMRLTTILDEIGRTMTSWAKELNLEHSEYPVFFDLSKLTVRVHRGDEYIKLADMGSAENWLGYHLIVTFALHLYFWNHNRPLPRFLFLVQLSQVYYPPELAKDSDGTIDILNSEDRKAVKRMFEFIFNITNKMKGDFQVIITDHAKLSDEEFTQSIRKEWRSGKKLIPDSWY